MMVHSFNDIKESVKNQALFKAQRLRLTSWHPSLQGDDSLSDWYSGWVELVEMGRTLS